VGRELAGNKRCCCCSEEHTQPRHFCRQDSNPRLRTATAVRRFYRSNSDLHHRPADTCASTVERHAGEQAISASVTATQRRFLRRQNCAGPRASPREAASRCVCQRRDSNPLFPWCEVSEIFTTSVGLAARAANRIENKFHSRRSEWRRYREPPWGSLCHRYPAHASFPPTGPALLGTRLPARAPGSGSPVPACAGMFR
jgi:hypothetical protein